MVAEREGAARSGAQSVERALAVLRCFGEGDAADLGITQLAAATGLTVSTTHRLVQALRAEGVLVQDAASERYRLGPLLVVLGRRAEDHLGFARAQPVLEALSETTGESVNLGIRSGAEVLVVLDVASRHPLRFDQAPGSRIPVHTSAMGKCLLAFSSLDPAAEVAALPDLAGMTTRTITDPSSLLAELAAVRARGWAINDEERNPGVRAVGAPVLVDGTAVAALAVQGPTVRLTDASLEDVADALVAASAQLAPLLVASR